MSRFNPEYPQTTIDRSSIGKFAVTMNALARATKASFLVISNELDQTIINSENIIDGRKLFPNQHTDRNTVYGSDESIHIRVLTNPTDPEVS